MMEPIVQIMERELEAKLQESVLQACREVGVVVDKERLVQALTEADRFYNEGYRDALWDKVVLCFDCEHYDRDSLCCSFWPDQGYRAPEHYCGEGVRREET